MSNCLTAEWRLCDCLAERLDRPGVRGCVGTGFGMTEASSDWLVGAETKIKKCRRGKES